MEVETKVVKDYTTETSAGRHACKLTELKYWDEGCTGELMETRMK